MTMTFGCGVWIAPFSGASVLQMGAPCWAVEANTATDGLLGSITVLAPFHKSVAQYQPEVRYDIQYYRQLL